MKKLLLTLAGLYIVFTYGFPLMFSGTVTEDVQLVLDESACVAIGVGHAVINPESESCAVQADMSRTVWRNNVLLEFPDGYSAEVPHDAVRVMVFKENRQHDKPWRWVAAAGGWLLVLGFMGLVSWNAARDLGVLSGAAAGTQQRRVARKRALASRLRRK